ncbi:MAG TPA: hypothetical protein VKR58_00085, partial [Aquella sp.]|nr:hypothetical protein [Aquella sp.]
MPSSKVKFDESEILTPDIPVGTSSDSEVYEIKDKSGEPIRVVTAGHKVWENQEHLNGAYKYMCHGCRVEHTSPYLVLPVRAERDSSGKLVFYGTGTYCCFECVYSDLKTKYYSGIYQRE